MKQTNEIKEDKYKPRAREYIETITKIINSGNESLANLSKILSFVYSDKDIEEIKNDLDYAYSIYRGIKKAQEQAQKESEVQENDKE